MYDLPVPGWKVIASVLVLGIVGTALAYVLYFALLRGAGASRAILVTYLVPAVAVLYGVLLLGEPLGLSAVGGLVLILCGVALACRRSKRPAALLDGGPAALAGARARTPLDRS